MNEVLRQEKKYLMNVIESERLRGVLEKVMLEDAHNGAKGYRIRSLYFDTLDDEDYYDKIEGIELRRKIRLRTYGENADFAMLELKQKEGAYQKKRSLRLKREDAEALSRGGYSVLLKYSEPFAAECYGLLQRKCYRPKTIVEYRRRAYIAKENKIRVTFDTDLVATESSAALFSPNLSMYSVLDPFNSVLEIKFNGFLLSYLKDLLITADRSELSVSKYCLARRVGLKFNL